ncbi:MAG: hypothetical protein QXU82_01445 [Candidatus Aenigmatarchaeota archaeon]
MRGVELPINATVILIIVLIAAIIAALLVLMISGASNPLLDQLRSMISGGARA